MKTRAGNAQKNKSRVMAKAVSRKLDSQSPFQFFAGSTAAAAQRKLKELADNSSQVEQLKAVQEMADNHSAQHQKENKTGLPGHLGSGIETLSGYSMDDVKVHYNSDKPARLQAHAYTQGTDIHLASGQEKHLPHEAWHVVQQMQRRVQPTMQMKGLEINDEVELEKEADAMGTKALQTTSLRHIATNSTPLQRKKSVASHIFDPLAHPQKLQTPGNGQSAILQAKGVIQRSVATKSGQTIYYAGDKELYTIDDQDGVFIRSNMRNGRNTVYKKVVNTGEQAMNGKDKYKLADPAVTVEIDETTLKSRLQEIGTFGDEYLMIPDHRYPHLSIAYTEEDGVITLGTAHYSRSHDDSRRLEYRRSDGGWTYHADVQGIGHAQAKVAADDAIRKATAAL